MKRLLWLPVAGFLLVAGAAVAAAAPGLADTAQSLLANQGMGSKGAAGFEAGGPGALLEDVLGDMVGTGVITQEQSDAIVAALTTAAEDRRAELEAQRAEMREMWTQIGGFLEDGVISADEIGQLPDDNPFSSLSDILADGQVTQEELESVAPFGGRFLDRPGRGPGHHGPHGAEWFPPPGDDDSDTDAEPDASASPATNS